MPELCKHHEGPDCPACPRKPLPESPFDPWEGTHYIKAEDWGDYCDATAEAETERRYERWLEDGGPHAEQIAWEAREDERRAWR